MWYHGAMNILSRRAEYSRAELLADKIVHISGVTLAAIAVPALIVTAIVLRGDFGAVFGVTVYAVCLLAMLGFSALYNTYLHPGWTWLLKRLDHSAIYLKIAGTYTPFLVLSGRGMGLLAALWCAAMAGVALKVLSPDRFRALAILLYLAMGWAGLAVGGTFIDALSTPVLTLVVVGGCIYTLGVLFYLAERLPFHYAIWHVLVLAASLVFYAAVTVHLVQTA